MINFIILLSCFSFLSIHFQHEPVVDQAGNINSELIKIFKEVGIVIPETNKALHKLMKENGIAALPTYSTQDYKKIEFLFLEKNLNPSLLKKVNIELREFYQMSSEESGDKILPYENSDLCQENLSDVNFITMGTGMYDTLLERFVTLCNSRIFDIFENSFPKIYFLEIPGLTINEERLGSAEQFVKSCIIAYKKLAMPEEHRLSFIESLKKKQSQIADEFERRKNINFEKIGKKELTQVDGLEVILNYTYFNILKKQIEIYGKIDHSQKDLKNYSLFLKEKKQEAINANINLTFIDLTTPFAIRHSRIKDLDICDQEKLEFKGSLVSNLDFDNDSSSEEYRNEEMEFRNLTLKDEIINMLIKTFRHALGPIVE